MFARLLPLNLIIILLSSVSYAQDYKSLLGQTNEWHLTECYHGCMTNVYFTDGDTVVNSKPHKILDGYHYISRTFLLHENVETRKVSLTITSLPNMPEYLLYDFSLNEGDSVQVRNPITPFPSNGGYFVLDSIRNKNLANGNAHRHFYLSPTASNTISTENIVWIEGVGSLSMINAPSGVADINGTGKLSCMFKDNELVYQDLDSISACVQTLSNNSFENTPKKTPYWYYNKDNGLYYLANAADVKHIEVYDVSGRLVLSQKISHHSDIIEIDLPKTKNIFFILNAILNNQEKKSYKIITK